MEHCIPFFFFLKTYFFFEFSNTLKLTYSDETYKDLIPRLSRMALQTSNIDNISETLRTSSSSAPNYSLRKLCRAPRVVCAGRNLYVGSPAKLVHDAGGKRGQADDNQGRSSRSST